ncbi:hypothetical protein ACH4UR_31420 [Streptomyces lydicus]|uniref:hypothetical protein n=1 Tax=Streptomyces lydicus TaxID=47763 RepID=UPI003407DA28
MEPDDPHHERRRQTGAAGILDDFLGGAALARCPHAAFGAIAALLAAALARL